MMQTVCMTVGAGFWACGGSGIAVSGCGACGARSNDVVVSSVFGDVLVVAVAWVTQVGHGDNTGSRF